VCCISGGEPGQERPGADVPYKEERSDATGHVRDSGCWGEMRRQGGAVERMEGVATEGTATLSVRGEEGGHLGSFICVRLTNRGHCSIHCGINALCACGSRHMTIRYKTLAGGAAGRLLPL